MKYDKIFMTPSPSFYKNNLFNEINKRARILVVYTGAAYHERNEDFYKGELQFDYVTLPKDFGGQVKQVKTILRNNEYSEIVYGGWDTKIVWWAIFASPKHKQSCIFESSINESSSKGIKRLLKKIFLSRLAKAYPSGILQSELLKRLGFSGEIIPYGGCGLLNYQPQPPYEERKIVKNFLYVGRLVEVKNLSLLIDVFNQLPGLNLTIIGFGPLEDELKKHSNNNISFKGAIDNIELPSYYKDADVFVLPSKSETWGLVVEEALNNGTPVVVSSAVGCRADLVTDSTGLVFESNDSVSLKEAIRRITDVTFYNRLRNGVSKLDFNERANRQINTFL